MTEIAITLYVDLRQGARLDLEAAGNASLAWSRLLKSVGHHVDPFTDWEVELGANQDGSLRIKSIIKLPEGAEVRGMIKGAIIASIIFILKEAISWGVSEVLDFMKSPDAPQEVQSLSQEDREAIAREIVELMQNRVGEKESKGVYDALADDPDVTGAGVTSGENRRPQHIVPRSNFPSQKSESEDVEERTATITEDVVLVRPILDPSPTRRWGFQSRAGAFGAPIQDEDFLSRLAAGNLGVPLAQGIIMNVDMEVIEEKVNGAWRPKIRTIKFVHEIKRRPTQSGLFDEPEQNNADHDDDD